MIAPSRDEYRAADAVARWVGRRLAGREPVAYAICMAYWVAFTALPVASALLLKAVFDRIQPDGGDTVWLVLAALAGIELSRWATLAFAVFQWHGCWVFWHTLPQANMLRSLVGDPGPVDRRLPESSGEAVSRFRDDTFHLAWMLDVWLDVIAAVLAALGAITVMAFVDLRLTLVVCLPAVVALWLCQWLGGRLRIWRRREREATAAVTGYIGDVFGAIGTLKLAGARQAVARRFAALGDARAEAAQVDQVATQTLQTVSAAVGDLGMGLVVLLLVPALARGDATVGDVGLFMASLGLLAGLPRWAARYGAISRQASVSVERLAELFPDRAPQASGDQPDPLTRILDGRAARIVAAHPLPLRHGPDDLVPSDDTAGPGDRLERLDVTGLTVRRAGLHAVDLAIDRGSLIVVTGSVGCGKSTLLRALLGLVARDAGEIRWNGDLVDDPSTVMVPPRAAYVAQTPRLFSEPLADAILLGVDPARVDGAVRLACLEDEVAWMPEGLATVVGARGVRLSGGQVQRTATARALVRRPELLVIDDVSSALDVETEAQLWHGLLDDGGAGVGALLVVSHRPAVLARADQVLDLSGVSHDLVH